jgi:hypothetical protein
MVVCRTERSRKAGSIRYFDGRAFDLGWKYIL